MDHTVTVKTTATTTGSGALLVLIIASLASAPVSWLVDGVTPSFVVYPLVLLIGLWRRSRGAGTLYYGIAGTIFVLVHLPWTWAAVTGATTNPLDHSASAHPVEWLISLFLLPMALTIAGLLCWRRQRR
jgi:hypothetical protein